MTLRRGNERFRRKAMFIYETFRLGLNYLQFVAWMVRNAGVTFRGTR